MSKHPLRAHLEAQIKKRRRRREVVDQDSRDYSAALFVLERLLEFPFEKFPDHAYPGHLLRHEHIRWHHVEQVIRFCELLKQPKGSKAGQPVRLLGFQVLIIFCILGPEDADTKLRLARTVVMTIGRKNAKSSTVAMMFLAMMSLDCFGLRNQDIQVGAADREQAGILFDLIQSLILQGDDLGLPALYQITPSRKTITHKGTYTKLTCLSSETRRHHGYNPCACLLDEIGNLTDGVARDFYSVLGTSFGSQDEGLLLMFSTQSPNDTHLFSEFTDRAKEVNRSGGVNEINLVGFIFDLPKQDDGTAGLILMPDGKTVNHFDERNWTRANPALEGLVPGGFRGLADLRQKAKEAKEMPSMENAFRNLQLNQRISATTPFVSQEAWNSCLVGAYEEEELQRVPCYVGIDLSARRDLTAVSMVWIMDNGDYYTRTKFYTPAEGLLEKSKRDRVPYDTWAKQGYIFPCPGKLVDYSIVAGDLLDLAEQYVVECIIYDRWRIEELRKECASVGFDPYESEPGDFWKPCGQGFRDMGPVVDAFEGAILDGKLRIEESPVQTMCASNCVVIADPAGNRKFDKKVSYGRIDGILAAAMAVKAATGGDLDDRSGLDNSVYEAEDGPGLLVL